MVFHFRESPSIDGLGESPPRLSSPAHRIMRLELRPVALVALVAAIAIPARTAVQAQISSGDLAPDRIGANADYLRITGGWDAPVSPAAGFRNWNGGLNFGLSFDSWGSGGPGGASSVGYGFAVDVGRLPFNQANFLSTFVAENGARPIAATASAATILNLRAPVRIRLPSYFVMPSVIIAAGYYKFQPASISYRTATGSGSVKTQARSGVSLSGGLSVERNLLGRFGIFGEGLYTYGWPRLAGVRVSVSPQCLPENCDALAKTTTATLRTGLRVNVNRDR
jgi:hypothetical protein